MSVYQNRARVTPMLEFKVTSERCPEIGEEERRRRLGQVYSLLLRLAADKNAADGAGIADSSLLAAVEIPAEKPIVKGV